MRITIISFILFWTSMELQAQLNVTPFVGINSTKMTSTLDSEFSKGGSFGFGGVEVEWKRKSTKHRRFYVSALSGISYLDNGYYRSFNFSITNLYYSHSVTNLDMKYLQIPILIRLNYQPFQLLDELHIFLGAGLSNNILTKAKLSEDYTVSYYSSGSIPPPPETSHYDDSGDVTSLRSKNNLFQRFEIGVKYKRFQVAFRISRSLKDLYCIGLENSWRVPEDKSEYIQSHNQHGKIVEKYSEFVLGFRLLKN